MKKTILEIYALAVCFVTVVCFVVALGIALYGVIGIASPEFTLSSMTYGQHQSNDAFWSGGGNRYCASEEKKEARPGEDVLTKRRQDSFVLALANERRDSAQAVVKSGIVIAIDLAVFLFHWLVARRARANGL